MRNGRPPPHATDDRRVVHLGRWWLAAVAGWLAPNSVSAHAFGARYDLPLPLWLYLAAAGTAVALSFAASALLLGGAVHGGGDHQARRPSEGEWSAAAVVLGALSVSLLTVVIVAGFIGSESPTGSFATVFVWIIWWVGLSFAQALLLDLWRFANPWRVLSAAAAIAVASLPRAAARRASYPERLGYWPALVGFLLFAWLELVSDLGEQPRTLALLISAYSVTTITGAVVFGVRRWFGQVDPFAVVFSVLGRFAPLEWTDEGRGLRLRVPGHGLLTNEPSPPSLTCLVVCLVATVSFDGFLETPAWSGLLETIAASEGLRGPLLVLQSHGVNLLSLLETAGLLTSGLVFVSVFLCFIYLVDLASGRPRGLYIAAGSFVMTLIPIAVGYHVAHYFSYLLIAGQLIIPLLSDPFALGWDLLGTRAYQVDVAIVNARVVWYVAVLSIVAGHGLAVYLAHATALRLYEQRAAALRSQVPMLFLMVGYTMTSLWILSQPIISG